MPNRYIRASAIESESVNALSDAAEVFYRRLLNRVDDFGRYTANLALLRAALYPLRLDSVPVTTIEKHLAECQEVGLVFTYTHEGKPFLVINKWEQGRAKSSEYPPPPADTCERMKTYVYTCKHKLAYAPDSDSDSDSDTDTDSDAAGRSAEESAPAAKKKQAKSEPLDDTAWLAGMAKDYPHADVPAELRKMQRWCEVNRRQPNRRRFVNWLNRVEAPLKGGRGLASDTDIDVLRREAGANF
jgi:hypothetical protein